MLKAEYLRSIEIFWINEVGRINGVVQFGELVQSDDVLKPAELESELDFEQLFGVVL